jgi:hypothetical protein
LIKSMVPWRVAPAAILRRVRLIAPHATVCHAHPRERNARPLIFIVSFAVESAFDDRELHLDPKDSRPRTPSLLADPAPPKPAQAAVNILADATDAVETADVRASSRGWRVPASVIVILGVVGIAALVYGGGIGSQRPGVVESVSQVAAAATHSVVAARVASTASTRDVAVILSEPAQDGLTGSGATTGVAPVDVLASLPANPATTVKVAVDGATGSTKRIAQDRPTGSAHASPAVRKRDDGHLRLSDSDVALLTDLITHVEDGGPHAWQKTQQLAPGTDMQGLEMQGCPRANTKAGLRCRERICKGHEGESPSCPASAGKS